MRDFWVWYKRLVDWGGKISVGLRWFDTFDLEQNQHKLPQAGDTV